jgi:hypothetical protein
MSHTHKDALQRVCEEIERVVWPIDRAFERTGRKYWIRPAEGIEVSEVEVSCGKPVEPIPPGARWYIVVKLHAPGSRSRLLFYATNRGGKLPAEKACRAWWEYILQQRGDIAAIDRQLDKAFGPKEA